MSPRSIDDLAARVDRDARERVADDPGGDAWEPPLLGVIAVLLAGALGGAGMGLVGWWSGWREIEIGLSVGPGAFATWIAAEGVAGFAAKARFTPGPSHARFGAAGRIARVVVGVGLLCATYALLPMALRGR